MYSESFVFILLHIQSINKYINICSALALDDCSLIDRRFIETLIHACVMYMPIIM